MDGIIVSNKTRIIVKAAVYNGYKNVLFMMKTDDIRLQHPQYSVNYTKVSDGQYNHKMRKFITPDGVYSVFSDHSVKKDRIATMVA